MTTFDLRDHPFETYVSLWGVAIAHTNTWTGWAMGALLVVIPLGLAWTAKLAAWLVLDGLTGGRLARQDVQRFEARHGRGR